MLSSKQKYIRFGFKIKTTVKDQSFSQISYVNALRTFHLKL